MSAEMRMSRMAARCRRCPEPVKCFGPYPDGSFEVSHTCDGPSWLIDFDVEIVTDESQHKGNTDGT